MGKVGWKPLLCRGRDSDGTNAVVCCIHMICSHTATLVIHGQLNLKHSQCTFTRNMEHRNQEFMAPVGFGNVQ